MKRKWMYTLTAAALLSFAGCSPDHVSPQKEAKEVNAADDQAEIVTGVKDVMQELQNMENYLKTRSEQDSINKFGKTIAEKWDKFEDDVEEHYPDQYKKIEDNLYPLIGETGKPQINIQKIKDLTQKVQQDLAAFLKQLQP
jgi:iron uptake system EfeUOB component EfeO/EfeM